MAPLLLAPLLLLAAGPQDPADTPPVERAAAIFEESCASCHRPPDARFPVDRAWLDQVHRTA